MELTVLGSGKSDIGVEFRNTAAHLVTANNVKLLLDCSDGTRGQLAKCGLTSLDIDAIFFSHFHPDHFSPNCFLQDYLVRWHTNHFNNKQEKLSLDIFGPKGLTEKIVNNWEAAWGEGQFKIKLLENIDLHIRELANGETLEYKGIAITAHKVVHGDREALAYKLQDSNKSLAYSGDATICEGLIAAAQDADVFLCEAALPTEGLESNKRHVNAGGAARVAIQANTKKLVLTHYSSNPNDMKAQVKKTGYKGAVHIATDLDKYQV